MALALRRQRGEALLVRLPRRRARVAGGLIGYCPGTGMAGAGEGSRDAMVGVLGMLAGAAVFVAGYNVLEPAGLLLGDWGKVTLPEVLGVSPWAIVAALAIGVPVLFWLLKPHEGRVRDAYCARAPERRRRIRSAGDRRPAWGTPVAGG